MEKRGRKSQASLSVVQMGEHARISAPDSLTDDEKALFNEIVASKAADFFDAGTEPLLVEMCRLKTQLDIVSNQIRDFDESWFSTDEGVRRYKSLCGIRDQGQGRMNALARSLRLTNQSRFQPVTTATRAGKKSSASNRLWAKD